MSQTEFEVSVEPLVNPGDRTYRSLYQTFNHPLVEMKRKDLRLLKEVADLNPSMDMA